MKTGIDPNLRNHREWAHQWVKGHRLVKSISLPAIITFSIAVLALPRMAVAADQQLPQSVPLTGDKPQSTDDWPQFKTPVPIFRKSFSTPLIFESAGAVQMVVPGAQWFVSYDPSTGNEFWRVDNGKGETVGPRPIYGAGPVYLSTGVFSGKPQLWAIRTDGQGDVTGSHVAWKLPSAIVSWPPRSCWMASLTCSATRVL